MRDLTVRAVGCASQPRNRCRGVPPEPPCDAEQLLQGCPRELAEVLRETGQWSALRCRPWLSQAALRGLLRSLQQCNLRELAQRYRESEGREECTYAMPQVVPWNEVDLDHVINAGQVFRLEDLENQKLIQLRRNGFQALRQGKVGIVLLAGGANLRLGGGDPPVGCTRRLLQLRSGKSIIQLCCERIRRVAALCTGQEAAAERFSRVHPEGVDAKTKAVIVRPSIPLFVMTSRLTHRCVVEHFEVNRYFGLPPRDVLFFEQPMLPALDEQGRLLPQSLGGEFAQAPGGAGQALRALVGSSSLEQMRDRGVDCVHIVGTENPLARVADPVFLGFCRDLEIDCACKIVQRYDPYEDLELFSVRQSPVSTQYADIEEAACGLSPSEVPESLLHQRTAKGALSCAGSINSIYMTLTYVEEVVGRPQRAHRVSRIVPYLDFYVGSPEPEDEEMAPVHAVGVTCEAIGTPRRPQLTGAVAPGTWPPETASQDFACQRALLAAAVEVRTQRKPGSGDKEAAWRCDVHLDGTGPLAVVRVRSAVRGPALLEKSLAGPGGAEVVASVLSGPQQLLRCSLVVPSRPNGVILETSLLDYFAYTERAVGLLVPREREFAPVWEMKGTHTPEAARKALHSLHCSWVLSAGARVDSSSDPNACLEVSPLLSYEGEGLGVQAAGRGVDLDGSTLELPCHLTGSGEVDQGLPPIPTADGTTEEAADGLDTRPFYLQEYPRRPEVSRSHLPRFMAGAGGCGAVPQPSPSVLLQQSPRRDQSASPRVLPRPEVPGPDAPCGWLL